MQQRIDLPLILILCFSFSFLVRAESPLAHPPTENSTHITLGESIVSLNGPWKFHMGDSPKVPGTESPSWASSDFDDSQWEAVDFTPNPRTLDSDFGLTGYSPGWTAKGHPNQSGYAWYRIRISLPPSTFKDLAFEGPSSVDDDYQVFANGVLLGGFGGLSDTNLKPVPYYTQPQIFRVPLESASAAKNQREITELFAVRVWAAPMTLKFFPAGAGGMKSSPLVGTFSAIHAHYQSEWLSLIRARAQEPVLLTIYLLLAFVACTLFLFDRSDYAYLWLATDLILLAAEPGLGILSAWTQWLSTTAVFLIPRVTAPLSWFVWAMLWWTWFRLRRPPWVPTAVAISVLLFLGTDLLGVSMFFHGETGPIVLYLYKVEAVLVWIPISLQIFITGFLAIRKEPLEGYLALPAILIWIVTFVGSQFAFFHLPVGWSFFGYWISSRYLADLAFVVVMYLLLMRRLLLSIRRQREMALDVKQAQEVQLVLLPEPIHLAGLKIETEYHPAREVGGDFFQIIPHPANGSLLVVAGDVTGKGLKAGMLVAVLVGGIRSTAEYTLEPKAILEALNRRLLGREGAAATCLAMNIGSNGTVTLANAGHLAPYLNGVEVPMEGALPLGMIPEVEFPVSTFQLEEGDRLVMISDGILEAQDKTGELFGFERVREQLQTNFSVSALVAAAQSFGQEDDISVVSVVRDRNSN